MGKALVLFCAAVIALTGCRSEPKVEAAPPAAPADTAAATRTVIKHSIDPTPDWVNRGAEKFPDRDPNSLYFLGIGEPNTYQAKARDSARDNAAEQIANFLMNSVKQAEYYSDKLQNSKGYVPVQELVRKTVGQHISDAVLRGQFETDLYFEEIQELENRVPQLYYQYYGIYAYPKDSLRLCLQEAKKDFQQQATAIDLADGNDVKKELVASSAKMIDDMAAGLAVARP